MQTVASITILCLGNPGLRYANTRHNIGWMVADAMVSHHNSLWQQQDTYQFSVLSMGNQQVVVVKPLTYMNRSGTVLSDIQKRFHSAIGNVVVVTDEYNFPVGRIHLKKGGSHGGHNGVASIIERAGTTDFWRLRCGIGRDFGPGGLVDYVLSPFPDSELDAVDRMIKRAVEGIITIASVGPERAMQAINRA